MTPYLIAATITAVSAHSLFGRLIARSPRGIAIVIPVIAAALGAYLYHPGKWSLIIPIVLVALFERFIARNPYRQEDDAPPAAGSDATVPLILLITGFLLSLNIQAYPRGYATFVPFVLMGVGTIWLLINPIRDTLRTPNKLKHLRENYIGVISYLLTLATAGYVAKMLLAPAPEDFRRFLIVGLATLVMHAYRLRQRIHRLKTAARESEDAYAASGA